MAIKLRDFYEFFSLWEVFPRVETFTYGRICQFRSTVPELRGFKFGLPSSNCLRSLAAKLWDVKTFLKCKNVTDVLYHHVEYRRGVGTSPPHAVKMFYVFFVFFVLFVCHASER